MKKIIFIFIFFTFGLCNSLFAQPSWFIYNPKPVGSGIYDIKMTDANTAYITTYHSNYEHYCNGTILKSTNSGINWNTVFFDSNYIAGKMFFLNSLTGYVTCYNRSTKNLLKTTNGGINWVLYPFANQDYIVFITSMYFVNENTGYISSSFKIYKTTNGGINYDSINVNSDLTFSPKSISFPNPNTGYLVGKYHAYYSEDSGKIYKSTNAGLNWFSLYTIHGNTNYSIQFFGDTGYCMSNVVLCSTNGGLNWVQKYYYSMENLRFINASTGFSPGGSDIWKTTDGASTWLIEKTSGAGHLNCIDAGSDNNVICGGWWGDIERTSNGGQNWVSNSISFDDFIDSSFPNSNTGYVLGGNGYLIKTTNGGTNWTRDSLFDNSSNTLSYYGIKFFTPDSGYYYNGELFTTKNGGNNWQKVLLTNNQSSTSVSFPNINTGFVFGYIWNPPYNVPSMQKTTNGGASWITIPIPIAAGSYSSVRICFPDENTGYFLSSLSHLYKITNGGLNWSILNYEFTEQLYNANFFNNNKGFVISSSKLYMTTDGGQNFTTVYNDTSNRYWNNRPIYFLNNNTGYFIGVSRIGWQYPDRIFCTTDGGYNWTGSDAPFDLGSFTTIYFFNSNTGMIFGGKGAIIKTTNGGLTFNSNKYDITPEKYILLQNYPNPFNPTTNIHYEIPRNGFVKLVVFDILGREIQTLVNEKQNAGTYEVTFNARQPGLGSNLSSGIYFYTLTSGDFKETKKFVLLK